MQTRLHDSPAHLDRCPGHAGQLYHRQDVGYLHTNPSAVASWSGIYGELPLPARRTFTPKHAQVLE
jgi:hypothetical protein